MKTKIYPTILVLFISSILMLVTIGAVQSPTVPLPEKTQYTIVIFTSSSCIPCKMLHNVFEQENIQTIVKNQYCYDIHWLYTEMPESQEYVKWYKIQAVPKTFILQRTGKTSGQILISQSGYMSPSALEMFLNNPARYQKKISEKRIN